MTRVISGLPVKLQKKIQERILTPDSEVKIAETCDVREHFDSYEVQVNGVRDSKNFMRIMFIPKDN